MELHAVEALARTLMDEHGIVSWTFAFDRGTRRMGLCSFTNRRISVSRHYAKHADEAHVRDTLLHEIAHVLAGPAAKHGPVWKAVARRIGATPTASCRNPFVEATRDVRTYELLRSVAGHPFHRVEAPGLRESRWRIVRENQATLTLVDEEGQLLRADRTLVHLDGRSAPPRAEARQAERARNLELGASKPAVRVDFVQYRDVRFALLRRGSVNHTLVNLSTGNVVRVPHRMVRPVC